MTYDPNNPNDPNRPLKPTSEPDLRTTPARNRPSWGAWIAGIVVFAIAAFAIVEWLDEPDTDPATTASTTNSEPALAPATPSAPADNNATPAPATPPAAPAQQ
ncbi:hypothetical protein ACDY96_28840 [Rhizobium mongolense]|uniref:hypothetical protein n=1 Tax=Rhizobium TaxID=379 RepID=UPI0024B108DD|nr:hypothetical protein [Rhizobium sp. CC1099]WFU87957.1 hypothetical protein QA644_02350 [Rhizobium sp. CC1099]